MGLLSSDAVLAEMRIKRLHGPRSQRHLRLHFPAPTVHSRGFASSHFASVALFKLALKCSAANLTQFVLAKDEKCFYK